uniref:Uncharacterized protein n=1 Tax=Romanomermis culicivorax TaxID=13658 RepID=A0A915K793_ROMCU
MEKNTRPCVWFRILSKSFERCALRSYDGLLQNKEEYKLGKSKQAGQEELPATSLPRWPKQKGSEQIMSVAAGVKDFWQKRHFKQPAWKKNCCTVTNYIGKGKIR